MSCESCLEEIVFKSFICVNCGILICYNCQGDIVKKCTSCGVKNKDMTNRQNINSLLKLLENNKKHRNRAIIHTAIASFYFNFKDYDNSLFHHLEAGRLGSPFSQHYLGLSYYKGLINGKIDYKEAERWFDLASMNGEYFSYYYLGLIYKESLGGIKEDPGKSTSAFVLGFMKGDNKCLKEITKAADNNFYGYNKSSDLPGLRHNKSSDLPDKK